MRGIFLKQKKYKYLYMRDVNTLKLSVVRVLNYYFWPTFFKQGINYIHCLEAIEGPTCGIMPIGAPATITTKGLKWNLGS